ncbi:MAG TPA: esterase-like activity of phytase family protein [Flavisolibacter sp.]
MQTINSIKFVDEYVLPHKLLFKGTTVGGLSSIDYNRKEDVFYMICDDRSDINPIRFYTAKIKFTKKGIDTVDFVGVTNLLQQNGQAFYNRKQNPVGVPDPEALRFNPVRKTLVWGSEGERTIRKDQAVLTDPALMEAAQNGQWLDSFTLPRNMRMTATTAGPRNNEVFEGIAFSTDFKKLFVSVEGPLYEDGPRPGLFDSAGWARIIQYDAESKLPEAQYAYRLGPVVQEPISEGLFIVNGITDILAINDHQLLVTERSFSTGRLGNNIRVYLVDITGADNISSVTSLNKTPPLKPLQKKLVLDMDRLGRLIDNIEGATFGPRLPNGKRSLLFLADDNFSPSQKTQFLLFEVE